MKTTILTTTFLLLITILQGKNMHEKFINNDLELYDVTLIAKDVRGLAAFYSKIGFGIHPHVNNESITVFPMPNQDLAIIKGDKNSSIVVSFICPDIDPILERLDKAKISYIGPKMIQAGMKGIEVTDPNGNRINFLIKRDE